MGELMKARTRTGCLTAWVNIIGRTEGCTMGNIQLIKRMDMGIFYGQQVTNLKDFGNEEINMEKDALSTLRASHELASGAKAAVSNG